MLASTTSRTISFRDNVASRHGDVYRSSAIFYVPPSGRARTTISILDYWMLKRGLKVTVLASTRSMAGELLGRERLSFDQGMVVNYQPPVPSGFEGSVEIEVLSTENLTIPYAAIIAWYDTVDGSTLVHSYARAYSAHEVEEGRTVTVGREACWTVRDDAHTRSFGVFHNGSRAMGEQSLRLAVRNAHGGKREVRWVLPMLNPWQSVRVEPAAMIDGLADWLDGEPGQAELDFTLGDGFTRMLVGNERHDGSDLQVTHSNFNYGVQPTDMAGPDGVGWMLVPALASDLVRGGVKALVYPQAAPGRYQVAGPGLCREFDAGETLTLALVASATLRFSALRGEFPTRLVTALQLGDAPERLPNECSLGVITALQPAKRLWWGPVRCEHGVRSSLVVHDLPEVYRGIPPAETLSLRLFSARQALPLERVLDAEALLALQRGAALDALWPDAAEFLCGEPGYYTLYCAYGGLTAYTLTRNARGSVCLEHGF